MCRSAPSTASASSNGVMRQLPLSLLGLLALISGCLVVEKRTLLIEIPADSKQILFYYVFEGISQLDGSELNTVQTDIERNALTFFSPSMPLDHPLLGQLQYEKLRYFVDVSRKRQLCADRSLEIPDRDLFASQLNKVIADHISGVTLEEFRRGISDIRTQHSNTDQNQLKETARLEGVGALANVYLALFELQEEYDDTSIEQLYGASQKDFAFVRFEPGRLRIVLPATADCARKIVANPGKDRWIKHIESIVKPVTFEARDDGLHLIFGNIGAPIQLQYVDDRKISVQGEHDISFLIGKPGSVLLNGTPATATDLITRFLNDPQGSAAEDAKAAEEAKKDAKATEEAKKWEQSEILMKAMRQAEAAKQAAKEATKGAFVIVFKSEGGRNFYRVQFRSRDAAELTTDQLSELATTVSSKEHYVVWFYLSTMDTSKKPWATSTRRLRKDVETRILNDR